MRGRKEDGTDNLSKLDSVHDDTLLLMNNKKDNKSISFPVVLDHMRCRRHIARHLYYGGMAVRAGLWVTVRRTSRFLRRHCFPYERC